MARIPWRGNQSYEGKNRTRDWINRSGWLRSYEGRDSPNALNCPAGMPYLCSAKTPSSNFSTNVTGGRKNNSPGTGCGTFACSWLCEKLAAPRASVRLRNGADELVAPRAPSSRQEYGPTRRDWGSLAGAIQEQEVVFEEKRLSN